MANEKRSIIKTRTRDEGESFTSEEDSQAEAIRWTPPTSHNIPLLFKQVAHYDSYRLILLLTILLIAHKMW